MRITSIIFPLFKPPGKDRWGRKKSPPPPAVTSHGPSAKAAGKHPLPLELKNGRERGSEKREGGEGDYEFLLLSSFLETWEAGSISKTGALNSRPVDKLK